MLTSNMDGLVPGPAARVRPALLHILMAQIRPKKADYAANLERLGELFARADVLAPRPHIVDSYNPL